MNLLFPIALQMHILLDLVVEVLSAQPQKVYENCVYISSYTQIMRQIVLKNIYFTNGYLKPLSNYRRNRGGDTRKLMSLSGSIIVGHEPLT